jgi:hypothetical protein
MRLPRTNVILPEAVRIQARPVAPGSLGDTTLGAGIQPQGCGVFDWIKCGGAIAGCVASCVALGPACIPTCVTSVAPNCLKCL